PRKGRFAYAARPSRHALRRSGGSKRSDPGSASSRRVDGPRGHAMSPRVHLTMACAPPASARVRALAATRPGHPRGSFPVAPGAAMYLNRFFGEAATPHPCANCVDADLLDFDIRMAFQPIVDARDRSVYGYEALVRTVEGGGAAE